MIKKSILYFIPCILSLTFVCGCINYTNTETKDSVHTLVIEENQEKESISAYADYRKPTKDVSQENNATASIDTPTKIKEKGGIAMTMLLFNVCVNFVGSQSASVSFS
mgnify:CR=1 FL=1